MAGKCEAPRHGRVADHGEDRTLDLRPFHYERIAAGRPIVEKAIV